VATSHIKVNNNFHIGSIAPTGQGVNAIGIGIRAGETDQGTRCIAIGDDAGNLNQRNNGIAIGQDCGETDQGLNSIAIGKFAAVTNQGDRSIAIGDSAANSNQGNKSIAIGEDAGFLNQGSNGIIISTTGVPNDDTTNGHIVIESSLASIKFDTTTSNWNFVGGPLNGIGNTSATATALITTVSGTYVVITGMTITPGAGTYLATFSGSVSNTANSPETQVSLFSNGSLVTHTVRDIHGGTGGNQFPGVAFPVQTQAVITVAGGQAIDARWQTDAGTATLIERSLILIRLDN